MKKLRLGIIASAAVLALTVLGAYAVAPTAFAEAAHKVTAWSTGGNSVAKNQFLGTTNNQPLIFKANNLEAIRILPNKNVGIGTQSPTQSLQVNGVTNLGGPGGVYGYSVQGGGNTGLFPTLSFNAFGSSYLAGQNGFGGIWQFSNVTGQMGYYAGSNVAAGQPHVNTPRFTISNNGNVGIGVNSDGFTPVVHVTSPGTILTMESSSSSLWDILDYKANGREWHVGVGGSAVSDGLNNKYYIYDLTGGNPRVVIDPNGAVGIGKGLFNPNNTAALHVQGASDGSNTEGLLVTNSDGATTLSVDNSGQVTIGALAAKTTKQVCINGGGTLAACSSAAEYVPSITSLAGYPETADLVSMAPYVSNPYGDAHGPFAVQKSKTACDQNLLGFIVNPSSGANGEKLNDHYLPLAIFGFFPAKVTMENGLIHRGDPITSSSKAGYGMKATGACKIIGYALEDASKDGTIQVFANHGDNAAAQVTTLQKENDSLKQELTAVEARLATLEGSASKASQSVAAAH